MHDTRTEMQVTRDDKGRIVGLDDATYEDVVAFQCPECGKTLFWQYDEMDIESARCCGREFMKYATRYTVEEVKQ